MERPSGMREILKTFRKAADDDAEKRKKEEGISSF